MISTFYGINVYDPIEKHIFSGLLNSFLDAVLLKTFFLLFINFFHCSQQIFLRVRNSNNFIQSLFDRKLNFYPNIAVLYKMCTDKL